ncbi:TolB family protein [Spirosoma gilvum]
MFLRRFLKVLLVSASFAATAQTLPILDQNPTSLRWYQLNTPHFRVLYPTGLDSTAQRTASRLEQLYEPASASLESPPRRLSVLLQNQTTNSNGFVTLFPRRSEFFAIPPQDPGLLGTFNWLDLLAVHEYRHVVQNDKALQGYGRVLNTLLGSTGLFLPLVTVPDWFAEGDAVSNETLLSTTGRGRIPNFDLGMRANLLAGSRFGYPKAVSGSYRDNVPNHYVLGYFLTTYLKRTYGPDVWSRVLNRNYRRFPWPFAFSASIKDETRLRTEDLYRKTMDDLTETWQKQQQQLTLTPADLFPVKAEKHQTSKPVFTNYQHPQFVDDSTVLCVKNGLGDTPRLVVLRKNQPEKTIQVQGFTNDPGMLSATSSKACWIEFGYDPRWGQRIYSNIRLLDLKTGKLTRLTHHRRYTAVAISPDNTKLIVVDNTERYKTRLLVISAINERINDSNGHVHTIQGRILKTFPNMDNEFYQHPRWFEDSKTILYVALKDGKKTLRRLDTESGNQLDLLPWTNENISHPQPWGNFVFYNSPRSGIDNIYAVNGQTRQVSQVTSRPLAAYHAAVSQSGNRLAFEDFSATGYRIADMPLNPADWKPVTEPSREEPVRYFGSLASREPGAAEGRRILADSSLVTTPYQPSRFRKLANALNIYSWGPVLSSTGQALSIGINSQDLLSTTQLSAGYTYNQTERAGNFYALLSYQGLYPIIDVSFQRGTRSTSLYIDKVVPADSLRTDRWTYNQLTAGFRLPLQLTNSKYIQSISLSAYYNYLQVSGYDLPYRYITEIGSSGSLSALTYGFSYSHLLRQSKRDVAPRWGQTIAVNYRTTPFGGKLTAEQLGIQGNVFLPGLGKHHSLRLRAGYQLQAQGTYQFGAAVFYPRGQTYIADDQTKVGSVEYRLPIADTHWSLGRWLYIQRIKAAGFVDGVNGQSSVEVRDVFGRLRGYETQIHNFQTTGLDVSFVFNALRLRTSFEAGFRSIYNLTTGQWLIQPLVIDIGI